MVPIASPGTARTSKPDGRAETHHAHHEQLRQTEKAEPDHLAREQLPRLDRRQQQLDRPAGLLLHDSHRDVLAHQDQQAVQNSDTEERDDLALFVPLGIGIQGHEFQRRHGQRLGDLVWIDAGLGQPFPTGQRGMRAVQHPFEGGDEFAVHDDLVAVDGRLDLLGFDRASGRIRVVVGT